MTDTINLPFSVVVDRNPYEGTTVGIYFDGAYWRRAALVNGTRVAIYNIATPDVIRHAMGFFEILKKDRNADLKHLATHVFDPLTRTLKEIQ